MKYFTFFLVLVLFSFNSKAQMQNGGFESWANGNPSNWMTNNILGVGVPVTQSSDAHSGSSSVRGEVILVFASVYPPILYAGNQAVGFPISEKYYTFKGWFKFSPVGGDILSGVVAMYKSDQLIGAGDIEITGALNSWTEINVPISYANNDVPDEMTLTLVIAGDGSNDPHAGSVFYADDFSMSTTITGINDPASELSFRMGQNYPNPFNPETKIEYSIPRASDVVFTVYNTLGNEVYQETFFRTAGKHVLNFKARDLSSGVYFYKITAGSFTSTRKFILMK